MLRFIIEAVVAGGLLYGLWYYKNRYRKSVEHHYESAKLWQQMMMNVLSEQVGSHFRGSPITNHVVRLKNCKIEILIGDDEWMVPVDMELFHEDVERALDEAYSKFMAHVR